MNAMWGFVNLKKCLSSPNHLIKFLVLIFCICFSVYQVGKCIEKLLSPPITTYYGFHLNESMNYPSVTICRRPGFNVTNFPKFGLKRTQNLFTTHSFRNFFFDKYTIKDFLNETTYSFNELIGAFAYNGYGDSLAEVDWIYFETISHGKCISLKPRVSSVTFSISGGWWFYLHHDYAHRIPDENGVSRYGFHIYVHDHNDILTSETEQDNNYLEYIYLEAAEDIRLHLRYQEFHRVHTRERPCIDPNTHPSYSRSKCLEECFYYQITNRTNCTLPWLWLLPDDWLSQCSSANDVQTLISFFLPYNRRQLVANCSCPHSCHVTVYTPSIISRNAINDDANPHSFIAMYYSNNIVTEMKEVVGYDMNGFISDIGGSLGFLLGLSVIGFITVLEKMICTIIKNYYKKKNKSADEQRSDTQSVVSSSISNNTKVTDDGSPEKLNRMRRNRCENLYENLRDFDTDDFKCYQKTLIVESSNKF